MKGKALHKPDVGRGGGVGGGGKTREAKNYRIKQNKHRHATNLTVAEGVALHKPGVFE